MVMFAFSGGQAVGLDAIDFCNDSFTLLSAYAENI
jgi:hypothetical protein